MAEHSPQPATLRSWRTEGCPISTALATFARFADPVGAGVALVSHPNRYDIARIGNEGRLVALSQDTSGTWTAQTLTLTAAVYEVRAFGGGLELRWLRDPAHTEAVGAAVLLAAANEAIDVDGGPFTPLDDVVAVDTIEQKYVLWGAVDSNDDVPDGWALLRDSRIGSLPVPLEDHQRRSLAGSGGRLALSAVEYVAVGPHGNAHVTDERLDAIVAFAPQEEAR